jgi:outer membrane cobalamin receptor
MNDRPRSRTASHWWSTPALGGLIMVLLTGAAAADAAAGPTPGDSGRDGSQAEAPGPHERPEAESAAIPDSLWRLEELVVWGNRAHTITDYVSRVDVVDAQRIRDVQRLPGANALTALATLPGIEYQKVGLIANGASGDPPALFRIRGIGTIPNDGLLILVDGRPQYVGLWGHALPDAHRLGPIRRIEAVRGPASVQYGGQAFGGAINIITDAAGEPGTEMSASGGNHGTYGLSLDHRGTFGPFFGAVSVSRQRSDGFRGGDPGRVDGARGSLQRRLGASWTLTALVDGTDSYFNNPGPESWPAGVENPYLDPDFSSGAIRQRAVDLSLEGIGRRWDARLKIYHNYVHNDFYRAGNTRARDFGMRLFGEARRERFALKSGFDLDRCGGNFAINDDPSFTPVDRYDLNAAPYALAAWDLSRRLSVSGGVRVNLSDRYDTVWAPQLRWRYAAGGRSMVTLAVANGFKNPSVAQQSLPFFAGDRTQLEPERLWQYEIGFSHVRETWSCEGALYQAEGDNLIRRRGLGWPPVYENTGRFRHRGLEATWRGRLNTMAGASLAACWMFERDAQTLGVPDASYRFDLWLRPRPDWRCDLSWQSEFGRYGADDHQARLRDLHLAALGISWRVPWRPCACPGSQAEIFTSVTNLGDREYRVFAGYPMPRLTYALGVQVRR